MIYIINDCCNINGTNIFLWYLRTILINKYVNANVIIPLHLTEYKIPNVPTKMRILHNKNQNIEKSRINDNFPRVEKMEKLGVFKTFFLILKLDIKKCPKWILKKKFAKMKIVFFSTFF